MRSADIRVSPVGGTCILEKWGAHAKERVGAVVAKKIQNGSRVDIKNIYFHVVLSRVIAPEHRYII